MNKLFTAISIVIASMFFFIVSITSLYAKGITYSGSAPTITGSANDAAVNNALQNIFTGMFNNIQNDLSKIGNMPNFIKSMSSANTFISTAATQINYPNYDLLAFTLGFSAAGVGYGNAPNDIIANGDTKDGLATQPWALQIGFHAGFLLDGLYLAGKFGYSTSSLTYGLLVNYELIKKQSLFESMIWRGFRLGLGVVQQQRKENITLYNNTQYTITTVDAYTLRTLMKSYLHMKINSKATVIPLEISTAMTIFFCTISAGAGVDINYGSPKLDIVNKSFFVFDLDGTPLGSTEKINIYADIKKQNPYYWSPKIMAGLSFEIDEAPSLIVTFPSLSYYFMDSGINAGFAIGMGF
jgi:hypothetical protein